MDVVVARCAGLDVGKRELMACVRVPAAEGGSAGTVLGSRRQVIRKFATVTGSLSRLAAWLAEYGVSEVVMEATGQYWKRCRRITSHSKRWSASYLRQMLRWAQQQTLSGSY